MDAHDLVAAVKALALELGRTPTRAEFELRTRGGKYGITKIFLNYSLLLQAAGLETYSERRAGATQSNAVFVRSLEAHTEAYEDKTPTVCAKPLPRAAIISDIHWPFANERVLAKFLTRIEATKPDYVVLDGDAWDMYSHTKFPRSHNLFTPREEQERSRKENELFWAAVQKAVPEAKCYQMLGNHDVRPLKRVLEAYPAAEDWIERMLREAFTFDGVQTIFDPREELFLGDVLVHHGYRSRLGDHRDYTHYNTVVGHTHVAGVVFRRLRGQTLWELNCGLAGDPQAKGLSYTPQKITNWTPAFGEIDEFGPRVILV